MSIGKLGFDAGKLLTGLSVVDENANLEVEIRNGVGNACAR